MSCELPTAEARVPDAQVASTKPVVAARPPVFVLNPYYTGIGIARSLRGTGVRVVALTSEADAPGVRSRAFDAVERVPNGRDDPRGLCDALIRLARGLPQRPVIFPTRDFDVIFLAEHQRELAA